MKNALDKLLWGVVAVLLVVLISIFLRHYLGMEFIAYSPGQKLNNPLAGLLATLCLLAALDPARKRRWLSRLAHGFTGPRAGWFFAALIGLEGFLLHRHLHTHNHPLWDLDFERGLGTYLATLLLFALGGLSLFAREAERGAARTASRGWALTGALFLYLALDECIGIHDEIGDRAAHWFKDLTAFHAVNEWLWVYAPWLALAGGYVALFLWRRTQEVPWARAFVFCGFTLWAVAIVLEVGNRPDWVPWKLAIGLEETAEMLGTTLLLIGLSRWIAAHYRPGSSATGGTVL